MKAHGPGFEYSWSDLRPVRAIAVAVLLAQIVGGVLGYFFPQFPRAFPSIWFGAAVGTLPAFLVGLLVQARWRPGSISANSLMVRRLGIISAGLTLFAVVMPHLGWGSAA